MGLVDLKLQDRKGTDCTEATIAIFGNSELLSFLCLYNGLISGQKEAFSIKDQYGQHVPPLLHQRQITTALLS